MEKRKALAFVKGGKDAKFPEPVLKKHTVSQKAAMSLLIKEDRREAERTHKINLDILEQAALDRFEKEQGRRTILFAYFQEPQLNG